MLFISHDFEKPQLRVFSSVVMCTYVSNERGSKAGTTKFGSILPEPSLGCSSFTESIMHSSRFGSFLEQTFIEAAVTNKKRISSLVSTAVWHTNFLI